MVLLHIIAGSLALLSAVIALCARKGGRWHGRSGQVFVASIVFMAISGAVLAVIKDEPKSVMAGALSFYLVCTAFVTVRWSVSTARPIIIALMLLGVAIALYGLGLGLGWIEHAESTPAYFVFGSIALLGAILDARLLRLGQLNAAQRLARHLWRMLFALLLATAAFFLGQADEFPSLLQNFALLSLPVIAVMLALPYWLIRVLAKRRPMPTVGA